jgi:hypothetical protein
MEHSVQRLYHCTLAPNLESIRKIGLLPRRGSLAAKFYPDAAELIYAVDEVHKGRLTSILTGQMAGTGLVRWSENYQFGDFKRDLVTHGAVVVFQSTAFCCRGNSENGGHPPSLEVGDWYSREPVSRTSIEREIVGQEMLDWPKPHEVDFTCRYRDRLRALSTGK